MDRIILFSALSFVREHKGVLTLGIKPTRPDTFYGYIQMGDEAVSEDVSLVKAFTEKPDADFARMFVDSGEFLWNTGLNLWYAETLHRHVCAVLPDHTAAAVRQSEETGEQLSTVIYKGFGALPNMSLDLVIQDSIRPVYVRECHFGWADMGNWHSIHDDVPGDKSGNVVLHSEALLYECSDNIVKMPRGVTVVMHDIHGKVVVQEGGVLLIAPKDNYADLRRIMTDAQIKLQR